MSQYDSTRPSKGDSLLTKRAKEILKQRIDELFTSKNHKIWIKEEVPYYSTDEEKPYHLDLCVLARDKLSFDNYSVFGIEIDGETHESRISDGKDRSKDKAFNILGIPIFHVRVEDVHYGKDDDDDVYFTNEQSLLNILWKFFMEPQPLEFSTRNQKLAIKLKENQLTICRNKKCQHKAHEHNLAGCNFQQPTKAANYCPCREPFMVSDM
jgi:hypothetical protein